MQTKVDANPRKPYLYNQIPQPKRTQNQPIFEDKRPEAVQMKNLHGLSVLVQPHKAPEEQKNRSNQKISQLRSIDYNVKNDDLKGYLDALDVLVGKKAENALTISNVPSDNGGYLDRWRALAFGYLENTKTIPGFIYAAYGYAVETLTNTDLGSIASQLPMGWTYQTQVSKGMTRPDIVISEKNRQVAWIDLTSEGSQGHILNKSGGGWKNMDYVFEITYPSLDISKISDSGDMIEGIKLRSSYKDMQYKIAESFKELTKDLKFLGDDFVSSTQAETKTLFEKYFDYSFSHKTIRSLIELGDYKIQKFGYPKNESGRDKSSAMKFIYEYYVPTISKYKK